MNISNVGSRNPFFIWNRNCIKIVVLLQNCFSDHLSSPSTNWYWLPSSFLPHIQILYISYASYDYLQLERVVWLLIVVWEYNASKYLKYSEPIRLSQHFWSFLEPPRLLDENFCSELIEIIVYDNCVLKLWEFDRTICLSWRNPNAHTCLFYNIYDDIPLFLVHLFWKVYDGSISLKHDFNVWVPEAKTVRCIYLEE